jgi:hypothetical protein
MKHPKRPYKPKLDPDVDLAGATPETLALALLGKKPQLHFDANSQDVINTEPEAAMPAVQNQVREPAKSRNR